MPESQDKISQASSEEPKEFATEHNIVLSRPPIIETRKPSTKVLGLLHRFDTGNKKP
jgi:hypothetical protein